MKRTKKFREFGQDQAKFSLFLSVVEPHKPVTSQTISKWIVSLIKLAYKDPKMKVKGHSTRAIGARTSCKTARNYCSPIYTPSLHMNMYTCLYTRM